MISNRRDGFTLVELMIVIVVVGILAAIAIPNYASTRARSYDASMKSDLRTTFLQIEEYQLIRGTMPASSADLETITGYTLSPGVTWAKFELENEDGVPSIHIHLAHPQSPNKWHAHYPAEGSNIELRG